MKRYLKESWHVTKEMQAEHRKLIEDISAEEHDPFLSRVDADLNNFNQYVFKNTDLHLRDANDKLLPNPFVGFPRGPYAFFIQASKEGGEEEIMERTLDQLEQLADAFRDYFGSFIELKENKRHPALKVMLFRTMKSYQDYNRIKEPERDRNFALAHYEPDKRRLCGPLDLGKMGAGSDPEHTIREVMFHEGVHQIMHYYTNESHLGNWGDMWSDEGLAEYFGGHSVDEEGEYSFDKINSRIASVAADDKNRKKRISMVELLSWMRSDYAREREENDREATRIHLHVYSQGWMLVHFLNHAHGGKYKGRFQKIMKRRIETGDSGLPVFRQIFDEDFEQLEEEYHAYLDFMTDQYRSKKVKNGLFVD